MGRMEFYDDEDVDLSESEREPSFSLHDFKKWLSKQKKKPIQETTENKDSLKEEFKKKVCKRVEDNINKKLKKKKSN